MCNHNLLPHLRQFYQKVALSFLYEFLNYNYCILHNNSTAVTKKNATNFEKLLRVGVAITPSVILQIIAARITRNL